MSECKHEWEQYANNGMMKCSKCPKRFSFNNHENMKSERGEAVRRYKELEKKVRELEEENKNLSERNAIIEVRIIKAIEANGRFEQHKVRKILKGEGE